MKDKKYLGREAISEEQGYQEGLGFREKEKTLFKNIVMISITLGADFKNILKQDGEVAQEIASYIWV